MEQGFVALWLAFNGTFGNVFQFYAIVLKE